MLQHTHAFARTPRDGNPVAVLLHGRGSDMHDLTGLRPGIDEQVSLVTPRAPFPGAPWGYGPGWAWYRYVREDRVAPETLTESLDALDHFLDRLPQILGARPGPLVLGGFSQGGTTSLAYGLTRPDRVALVANFSGFLVAEPDVEPSPRAETPPVFWGHGLQDPAIPHGLAVRGREQLEAWGVDLTARDYPIGHWIAPEELADFNSWVEERLP